MHMALRMTLKLSYQPSQAPFGDPEDSKMPISLGTMTHRG